MINVLMVVPDSEDGTSVYRGYGPMTLLRKQKNGLDLNLLSGHGLGEENLNVADIVFMQRPHSAEHVALAKMAKNVGIPVWCDWDDLLTNVPPENPQAFAYMTAHVQENVRQIVNLADAITVSTPYLKREIAALAAEDKVIVVRNGLPDRYVSLAKPFDASKLVCWRGGNTHVRDLHTYQGELRAIVRSKKTTFMGFDPWFITQYFSKAECPVVPALLVGEYFRLIPKINPSVILVPLCDNPFNRAKSNIAWLEGVMAGAVCVGPDWEEWKRPGVFNYEPGTFFETFLETQKDTAKAAKMHAEAWDFVRGCELMSHRNLERKDLIEGLLS